MNDGNSDAAMQRRAAAGYQTGNQRPMCKTCRYGMPVGHSLVRCTKVKAYTRMRGWCPDFERAVFGRGDGQAPQEQGEKV